MIASLLLVGGLLAAQAEPGGKPDAARIEAAKAEAAKTEAIKASVRRLTRQLDAPKLAARDAAEQSLLDLGPEALDALPEASDQMTAEVKQRLDRVRQKLEQAAADAAVQASLVTLNDPAIPLSKCLAEITRQTGNPIVDRRDQMGQPKTDPTLKIQFNKTPFWKAIDEVCRQAGMVVYPFGEDRSLVLMARPQGQKPLGELGCVAGPFRILPQEFIARRAILAPDRGSLRLSLNLVWEPRLSPVILAQPLAAIKAVDEHGKPLAVSQGRGELEVTVNPETIAAELSVPLDLPSRDVKEIAQLKGSLRTLLPGPIATFRFGDLAKAKDVKQRKAGVQVMVRQLVKNNEVWEVWVVVKFDKTGGALESHRDWVFRNEAYLETPDGKRIDNDGFETSQADENEIGLVYLFALDAPPDKHTFVYKTPSTLIGSNVPYELKNLKLP